ncbi:hypothetical protein EW145_g7411 [Phellinidium pouzarii]|uniref:Uncharacterized protein n=1 Tax=Phellinidium pouzarii TaxID=167371 RepID=A0A4S4KJH5_9AGAM|nr:hypothetical protein EW145_g7411 [Phellinidium pouzarii]
MSVGKRSPTGKLRTNDKTLSLPHILIKTKRITPTSGGEADLEVEEEVELGDADLAAEEETTSREASPLTDMTKRALDKKKAQEQAKPAVNNPGNTLAIAAPPAAATATANIATTSSATIEELPPTPISGSPLTSTTHFANENSLFDFLGEHGADYDINTMEMDHFDANIGF